MILGCGQGLCLLTFTFPFAPPGIALYPGQAQLLSCKHHYEVIPPLRSPGRPGDVNCTTQRINYTDPFSNQTLVRLRAGSALSQPRTRGPVFFLPGGWCGPSAGEHGDKWVVAVAGSPALGQSDPGGFCPAGGACVPGRSGPPTWLLGETARVLLENVDSQIPGEANWSIIPGIGILK